MEIVLLVWCTILTFLVLIIAGFLGPETDKEIKSVEARLERLSESRVSDGEYLTSMASDIVKLRRDKADIIEFVRPLLVDKFKDDINLVTEVDHPGMVLGHFGDSLIGKFEIRLVSTTSQGTSRVLKLEDVIERAKTLRSLKPRLCCKEPTKKVTKKAKWSGSAKSKRSK